jgi:hypothetical protein
MNILAIMHNDMLFVGISAPKSSWHNWMIAILMSFIIQQGLLSIAHRA